MIRIMNAAAAPSTPRRRATYEDLLKLPAHVTGELIEGELFALPRPRVWHASSFAAILRDVSDAFGRRKPRGGPGGWILLGEPELHMGVPDADTLVLVPDIAGWRRERMPEPPDTAAIGLVPDWVCEVLSPGTESHDRIRKMAAYGRAGVQWAWIVDADEHSVEVYERVGAEWRFHGGFVGGEPARIQPFDAVEFDLSEWWSLPPDPAQAVSEP